MYKLGETIEAPTKWGNKLWLVKDSDKKRKGDKRHYLVMGLSKSGWWRLFYGTLKECRQYIDYETGKMPWDKWHKVEKSIYDFIN